MTFKGGLSGAENRKKLFVKKCVTINSFLIENGY